MILEWHDYYNSSQDEIDVDIGMANELRAPAQQYVKIEVRNPRTHISREKALYTDYEVIVETNNITFASTESCVRRRYSDFQWLRNRLFSQYGLEKNLPELPPKRLFGRFKRPFLKHRQRGLQRFLEGIINETSYLSDITVHLFLQSSLRVNEIESKLNGTDSGGELIEVLQSPSNSRGRGLSRSSSQVEGVNDVNFDHDSGFSYSTTSSLNDGMTAHAPLHKPVGNGHCFASAIDIERENHKCFNNAKRNLNFQETSHDSTLYKSNQSLHVENTLPVRSSGSPLVSSSDEELFPTVYYDADDEVDFGEKPKVEENNNYFSNSDDDDVMFCFRKDNQGTVYSLDRALEIIRERPKLTDRLYSQEDSDDCFHESEYDVIDTEDDLDITVIVDDETYPKANIPKVIRSNSYGGEELEDTTYYISRSKNKLKTGKVKSLPNIRFPIRNKKANCSHELVKRSHTYHGAADLRREILREVDEREEILIGSNKIDPMYLVPCPKTFKSESEGHNQTSDADYLQTIHKQHSNDSHDTHDMDSQGEDNPPSKFYDFFKKRKKTKQSVKLLSFQKVGHDVLDTDKLKTMTTVDESNINTLENTEEQTGRFRVSSVVKLQNLDNTASNRVNHDIKTDDIAEPQKIDSSNMCITVHSKSLDDSDDNEVTPISKGCSTFIKDNDCEGILINDLTHQQDKTCYHDSKQEHICGECNTNGVCSSVAKDLSIALLRSECQFSSTYNVSSEELYLREETVSLRKTSLVNRNKRCDSLLKTYDIITI